MLTNNIYITLCFQTKRTEELMGFTLLIFSPHHLWQEVLWTCISRDILVLHFLRDQRQDSSKGGLIFSHTCGLIVRFKPYKRLARNVPFPQLMLTSLRWSHFLKLEAVFVLISWSVWPPCPFFRNHTRTTRHSSVANGFLCSMNKFKTR